MTKEDIIRMAQEANLPACHTTHPKALERFAKLVAEQTQQAEPVATIGNWGKVIWAEDVYPQLGDKLYATPPQRKPLTDKEIMDICASQWASHPVEIARAIEAAHGIKENT